MPSVTITSTSVSAHGRVYRGLKEALMSGQFQPGERLVVRVLAERFRTSPMPVREALHRLVSEEAVVDVANRGVIVPEVTTETISDLVRVRSSVEGAATEWAAATIGAAELAGLQEINDRMKEVAETGHTAEYLSLNRDFHFTIYRASRSQLIQPIIERLWLRAGPWLNLIREGATLGLGLDHHDEMLDALSRGDGVRARRALVADIADAADVMLRSVRAAPAPKSTTARKGPNSGSRVLRRVGQA
ncbi:MAG TPA: GntR family transcriptional regulator [Devosiaceae bacterium]|jgi:DNA-binding GntR family transcriptional regulator|nr:GntR family transcriptional regulator [Devosiaceae bacterium]